MLTACGVAVEEGMDNPDFWCEFSVTWLSFGADRVVSVLTPYDYHHVGPVVGASAGPLRRGGCDSNDVSDVVRNGSAHLFGSMAKCDRFSRVLGEDFSLFEADGSHGLWQRYLLDAKGHQRPFPILDDPVEPVEDIVDGSIRSESGQLESPANADAPCVLVDRVDDGFERIMLSSLVSHVVVGRGLRISRRWRLY